MLKIENLEVCYGHVQALQDVNLEVNEGELVTLIGANGAGKSTTLRAISGLVPVAKGTIRFNDRVINGLPPYTIVELGIAHCPEGRRVWPMMTVYENLQMGAYTRKDRAGIAEDLDRMFDFFPRLKERRSQLAGSLSGGEQQMLAVARALMSRPKVLLFDEPSLGLSPILVEKTAEIIRNIHKAGMTVLLVEQNAFLALNLADRAYVIEIGKTTLSGTGKELLENDHVKKAYLGG